MDIRMKTALVIRREDEYLVGRILDTPMVRWSKSPWDAWKTRSVKKARAKADKYGGVPVLFNPVAGQIKELEAWQ